jgi:exodeoxyribonuclease V alpha subunit
LDNNLEILIVPEKKFFYSYASSFGIYRVGVKPSSKDFDKLEIDTFGTITIKGSMPELEIGTVYVANVTPKMDKKYGLGYEVNYIFSKPLTTIEEQISFLRTLLTQKQVDSILEVYPNDDIIDLIKTNRFDYSKVKNIGEVTYNKIKEKILQNEKYQNAIIELTCKLGIPYKAVKKMSDFYGSPDILVEKINENPYLLIEVDGFGFKKVDELALSKGIEKTSPNRIKACVKYILDEQANDGHCWVKLTKTISEATKLLGLKIDDVEKVLNESDEEDFVVRDNIVYLKKYYLYEEGIKEHILRLLDEKTIYKIENIEEKIKKIEEEQGFSFTEEQRKAIYLAIENNVLIVNGKAGTGKTSVIKGIVEVLKSVDGLEYATCALSGKASQRIHESTGLDSYTTHRILGYNPEYGFLFDEHHPLPYDVIILDEASMINSQLFFYLVRAIKNGAKFIITGDTAQLEPIGVGNCLVDLIASDVVPKVELTIVHRQAQKSGILSCANKVREGIKFLSDNDYSSKKLGELKDLYVYPYDNVDDVYNAIIKIAKEYNGDILDFQVIVPMKNRGKISTLNLNNALQIIFNESPEFVDQHQKIERKNFSFLVGDKVIINGNNYDKGVFNGTIGIIEYIDSRKDGEIVINFENVGRVTFKKEEMSKIDLAYAISTHKSQGSQWRYVVFALDYSSYVLLNRQLVYTGMTRAREALFMPVELKALQHAIKTDNSTKRLTFLHDLLVNAK